VKAAALETAKSSNRETACRGGHVFTIRTARGHREWHCIVCYFIPSEEALLAAYVEKHGGRIVHAG